jgi:Putative Ig domain
MIRNRLDLVVPLRWLAFFIAFVNLGVTVAAAGNYTVSPNAISFPGVTTVGVKSNSQTVTVVNTSAVPVSITSFSLMPFYVFQLDYGFTRTLQPGEEAQFGIRFVPAKPVQYNGTLVLNFSDGTLSTVTLSGNGAATAAVAKVSPSTVNFPATPVGVTASQVVTVFNQGTSKMSLTTVSLQPPFGIKGFTTAVGIDPGKSFSFQITLRPGAVTSYTNAASLAFDVLPTKAVALTGRGTAPTTLVIPSFPIIPDATRSAAYKAIISAVGGTPPYTFGLGATSTLPAGLSLSSAGVISGTLDPSVTTGTYPFTATVRDSSHPGKFALLQATLTVRPQTGSLCNNIVTDVPNTNVPMIPLNDLGTGTYLGMEGGLYGGGSNVRPPDHDAAGVSIAQGIGPLDANGNPDPNGSYALLAIGVSVTRTIMDQFQPMESADPVLHPNLKIVNGAINAVDAPDWADPTSGAWQTVLNFYLPYQGLTAQQVVAAYVHMPHPGKGPGTIFPADQGDQETDLINILKNLHTYFPNLKLAYLSSPYYGGYAGNGTGYVEPNPYESGFAFTTVILDQINGDPDLNYNPANGPVMAPWISWGPYLWANGLNPRIDGLVWSCQDLNPDGTHPSTPLGRDKAAGLVVTFFKTDDTTTLWYLNSQNQPAK